MATNFFQFTRKNITQIRCAILTPRRCNLATDFRRPKYRCLITTFQTLRAINNEIPSRLTHKPLDIREKETLIGSIITRTLVPWIDRGRIKVTLSNWSSIRLGFQNAIKKPNSGKYLFFFFYLMRKHHALAMRTRGREKPKLQIANSTRYEGDVSGLGSGCD